MEAPELLIYVSEHCYSCQESFVVAEYVRLNYPHIRVRICNVDVERPSIDIFAVPTYALNGKIVFLGNPTDEQLEQILPKSSS